MQTDTAIRKWAVAKNQELHRCGDGLYVRGFLSGRKLFQVRLSVDNKRHWIDVGDYPQKSLAASREISLVLKRVAKARGASLEQIKRAALLATSASDFEANLNGAKVETTERTGIPTFGEFFKQWYQLQISADRWTHKASINKPIKAYENHLEAKLGNLRIDKITRLDLKNVLQPIYLTNRKLGPDLRAFVAEVFEDAVDAELIDHNPVPPNKRFVKSPIKAQHAPSIHFDRLPELWQWLEQAPYSLQVKVAMRTAIVTVHRASVVAFAR